MLSSARVLCLSLSLLASISACGPAPTPPSAAVASSDPPATRSGEPADASADATNVDELLARANTALKVDQLFEPAGSSALDLYLAAREAAAADSAVADGKQARRLTDAMAQVDPREQIQMAIADIFPYGLIWVERAIADNRRVEAERVIGLLERAQPVSISLGRLRELLAQPQTDPVAAIASVSASANIEPDTAQRMAAIAASVAQSASTVATTLPTPTAAQRSAIDPTAATAAPASTAALASVTLPVTANSQTPPNAKTIPQSTSNPAFDAASATPARPTATRAPPVPVVLSQATPRYPPRALKQRLEGWVLVGFTIRPDGRVDDVNVLNAEPAGVFDREAVGSMQRWQFQPPGQAITAQRRIDFKLGR